MLYSVNQCKQKDKLRNTSNTNIEINSAGRGNNHRQNAEIFTSAFGKIFSGSNRRQKNNCKCPHSLPSFTSLNLLQSLYGVCAYDGWVVKWYV